MKNLQRKIKGVSKKIRKNKEKSQQEGKEQQVKKEMKYSSESLERVYTNFLVQFMDIIYENNKCVLERREKEGDDAAFFKYLSRALGLKAQFSQIFLFIRKIEQQMREKFNYDENENFVSYYIKDEQQMKIEEENFLQRNKNIVQDLSNEEKEKIKVQIPRRTKDREMQIQNICQRKVKQYQQLDLQISFFCIEIDGISRYLNELGCLYSLFYNNCRIGKLQNTVIEHLRQGFGIESAKNKPTY